jgi:hypothetical protein
MSDRPQALRRLADWRLPVALAAAAIGAWWSLPTVVPRFAGHLADGRVYEIYIEPTADGGGHLRVIYAVAWNDDETAYEMLAHRQADAYGRPIADPYLPAADRKRLDSLLQRLEPFEVPARFIVERSDGVPTNPRIITGLTHSPGWGLPAGLVLIALGPLWWFSHQMRRSLTRVRRSDPHRHTIG